MLIIFSKKNPQKTDNRMSMVVLDFHCSEIKTVEKLVVQNHGLSFFLPKHSNQHPNLFGVLRIFIESVRAALTKSIMNLKNISRSHRNGFFFAKAFGKSKFLSELPETNIMNLDDYACPKIQYLIFKDEEND